MTDKLNELTKNLSQSLIRRRALKKFGVGLAGMALACVILLAATTGSKAQNNLPSSAAALLGNLGATITIRPAGPPGLFNVIADGAGQSSITGNFADHAELQAQFPPPGSPQPVQITGHVTWTTSDGGSALTLDLAGTATYDPANPTFFNVSYQATITGGTGAFAGARGTATVNEVGKLHPDFSGGIVSLTFRGYVVTPRSRS